MHHDGGGDGDVDDADSSDRVCGLDGVDEFGQMSMFAQQHSSQKAETEMEQYYQLLIGPRILQHQLDSLVHLLYFL